MGPDAGTPMGRCGRYDLLRRVGIGGMGEVFLARTREGAGAGEFVAIKRLLPQCASDPAFIGMFLDEARLTRRLVHPNICRVMEHGQSQSHYFLAMEHIEGVSLKEILFAAQRHREHLPVSFVSWVIAQTAAGLDHAHRVADEIGVHVGVVHRDVSPANIMVSRRGEVKIVDFGLAKARTQLHKTMPGLVKGKFGYMAPEQLGGEIDWRTDIFALGLCMYEALTGVQMFPQPTAALTVQAVAHYTAPPPIHALRPEVPEAFEAVLARACARGKKERFQSAAEMQMVIERILAHHRSQVGPELAATIVERYYPLRAGPTPLPALPQRGELHDLRDLDHEPGFDGDFAGAAAGIDAEVRAMRGGPGPWVYVALGTVAIVMVVAGIAVLALLISS